MDLKGKVAFVTGGSGDIGSAIAGALVLRFTINAMVIRADTQ